MATMGEYCKAYLLKQFRQYQQWQENSENAATRNKEVDGKESKFIRELNNDSVLYLQSNYLVTDGIFQDENIIFDRVTPEWKDFCDRELNFKIPNYSSQETTINV